MKKHHFDHGNHAEQEWTTFAGKIAVLRNRKPARVAFDSDSSEPHRRQEWTLFHDKIPVLQECEDATTEDEELHHSQQEWTMFEGKIPVLRTT
eukprot:CAMPEP_0197451276 /NCGR_PEP_ID=MMETSP1175-20131217/28321_1 /TAXON_ID=1003142 /ORGANISM="Triceratium dubium, Strain CCMP147" /LENGTH=92 /DNA_ID=CAMNT_0042983931 /DNA_START=509 /DNA_END=787 /DNA_ORIENTATION=+